MTAYIALSSLLCLVLAYTLDWTRVPGAAKPSFDLTTGGVFHWLSSSSASVWIPLIGLDIVFDRLAHVLAKELPFVFLLYIVAFAGLAANPRINELRSGRANRRGVTTRDSMTEAEAEKIVYSFVDVVAVAPQLILDSRILPYPKETIREAFAIHLRSFEVIKSVDPATAAKLGIDKKLESLSTCRLYIDRFRDIAPEDAEGVARVNRLRKEDTPWPDEAFHLISKYLVEEIPSVPRE